MRIHQKVWLLESVAIPKTQNRTFTNVSLVGTYSDFWGLLSKKGGPSTGSLALFFRGKLFQVKYYSRTSTSMYLLEMCTSGFLSLQEVTPSIFLRLFLLPPPRVRIFFPSPMGKTGMGLSLHLSGGVIL